jgi:hypothetical protein
VAAGAVLQVPVLGEGGALLGRQLVPVGADDLLVLGPAAVLIGGERLEDLLGLPVVSWGALVGVDRAAVSSGSIEVVLTRHVGRAIGVEDDGTTGPVDAVRHTRAQTLGQVLGLRRGDLDARLAQTQLVAGVVGEHPDVPLASQGGP